MKSFDPAYSFPVGFSFFADFFSLFSFSQLFFSFLPDAAFS